MRILVVNGPNLNLLGTREPEIYGHRSYGDLVRAIRRHAAERKIGVTCVQSNHEGDLIDLLQNASRYDAIVINPGAFAHYSYALRDCIKAIGKPVVEVHLSDIKAREPFRAVSVTAEVCVGQISGKGFAGYLEAIDLLAKGQDGK